LDTTNVIWENKMTTKDKDILAEFFYSIVVNYSIQAYISDDYKDSPCQYSWVDYLFHKNDGYTAPLVLNPKRDDGTVDMNNEYKLISQRLSSLLIDNNNFLLDYSFSEIEIKFESETITDRFKKNTINNIVLSSFCKDYAYKKNSIFVTILNEYGITYPFIETNNRQNIDDINQYGSQPLDLTPNPIDIAYHYLVLKTISISQNYKTDFKIDGNTKNDVTHEQLNTPVAQKKIKGLVTAIQGDNSHITVKIKRVLNFIEYAKKHPNGLTEIKYNYLLSDKNFTKNDKLLALDQIIAALPPSFYIPEIFLIRKEDKTKIPISLMSSGERQFLFSMSTVLYHIKNLMSVPDNDEKRVKYNNFNIILDEIELCFHPEYQREFVQRLLGYLDRIVPEKDKNKYHFNIILSTHSPFILSDIPKCNVMFLKDGKQVNEMQEDTFGANIHSLMQNAFFLTGTIGEFAKEKINKMFKRLYDGDIDDKLYTEIKLVSEPFIRSQLLKLYNELVPNKELQKEIDDLKAELKILKEQINDKDRSK